MKNFNSQLTTHNSQLKSGFTLIETIVTILLFAVLGTIATTSLFSILRATTKSEVLKEVKQNGDFALSRMVLKIRNASDMDTSVICDGSPLSSLVINNKDGFSTTYACTGTALTQQDGSNPVVNLTGSSVAVSSCTGVFTCTSSSVAPKRVTISFTLTQAGSGTGAVDTASQTFQTQVTLRNKSSF